MELSTTNRSGDSRRKMYFGAADGCVAPAAIVDCVYSSASPLRLSEAMIAPSPMQDRPGMIDRTSAPLMGNTVTNDAPRSNRAIATSVALTVIPNRSPNTALGATPTAAGVSRVATHVPVIPGDCAVTALGKPIAQAEITSRARGRITKTPERVG